MSAETLDYLLSLALREQYAASVALIDSGEETSVEWGVAAAAVRELLILRQRAA